MSFDSLKNDFQLLNCGVAGCYGKDEFGRDTLNGVLLPPKSSDVHTLPYKSGDKLEDAPKPKVQINYVNTAIFGAIGGGAGYLVAKNLIKTDKVLIPMLIGAAAFAYYQMNQNKK